MDQPAAEFRTEDDARCAIVDACLRMGTLGINQGRAGNVSVRWHRGMADGLLVTPSAMPYERMGVDDIVWLPLAAGAGPGEAPTDGSRAGMPTLAGAPSQDAARASSEWRIHHDVYVARPGFAAVVHAHPPHASALACLPRIQREGIPAFHYMVAMAGGHDIRCAAYATFGTPALSAHALAALRDRRACLLANHGIVACHASLERALALAMEVETLARMYCLALQLGEPTVLGAAQMDEVLARFGSSAYGR